MKIKVGLFGFGRTGSTVAQEIVNNPQLSLEWVCRKNISPNLNWSSHSLGYDENFAPFVASHDLTPSYLKKNPVDIVIDFSSGAACEKYELLAAHRVKIVSAISHYNDLQHIHVQKASSTTAILHSPNITLGINWLMIASKLLKNIIPSADIEIVEEHFRDKKEASGTALKLAKNLQIDSVKHVNSIRVGGIVGKHEVIFGLPHQTIRLTHESISRSAFGTGAIFAAQWLMDKEAGLHSMENMFYEKFISQIKEVSF